MIEIDAVPCSNNIQGLHDLYLQLGNGNGDDGSGNGSGIDVNAACDTEPPADNYGDNDLVRGVPHFGCNTDGTVTATTDTVVNDDGSYTVTVSNAFEIVETTYYPDGRTQTVKAARAPETAPPPNMGPTGTTTATTTQTTAAATTTSGY